MKLLSPYNNIYFGFQEMYIDLYLQTQSFKHIWEDDRVGVGP